MGRFTDTRTPKTPDECWLVEHPPVFTLGRGGDPAHVLGAGDIPVIRTDRGGQVTYHGPGQVVAYLLLDLHRLELGVRELVQRIEAALIDLLGSYAITGEVRPGAPGVYVGPAKIASLGLRVRRGRTFHGLSLNHAMDLEPFSRINPCGYPGLAVTDLARLGCTATRSEVEDALSRALARRLGLSPTEAEATLAP